MSDGRYQAYSEYKASEITWLGKVPAHWTLIRFKHVFTDKKKTLRPDLPPGSISFGRVVYKDTEVLSSETKAAYQEVLSGEFLVNPLNLNYDLMSLRTALSSIDVVVSTGYIVLQSTGKLHPNYARWLLQQFDVAHMKTLGAGVRQTINYADIGNSFFFEPSQSEQIQIAAFLDHETAKIDRLIEKQQGLIALLKEKRQAVISHAVTQGINPHAPRKDSGIEWLGEVPTHWKLKNYRYASRIYRGKFGHRPRNDPAFYDGKYPFIQTGDIARAGKNITSYSQTLNERGIAVSQKFPAGTLVMAIAANIGDTAILGFEAYAPDSVVGFKPCEDVDLGFLRYSLMAALPALERTSTQSTQANLNIDRIGSVQAAFPPIAEQREIVLKIEALLQNFGTIETEAQNAIELMQERRTALISAAVTGKIDVRAWQPPVVSELETTEAVTG